MGDTRLNLHLVLIVLFMAAKTIYGEEETNILYAVTHSPKYFGLLEDLRHQPLSVEISEGYMDQDYIAASKKRHKINWNKNPPDVEDFDEEESEEGLDKEKDKDAKIRKQGNDKLLD